MNEIQKKTKSSGLSIREAFNSPKINESSQTDLSTVLAYCITMLEVKQIPEDYEKLVLIEKIQEKHGNWRIDELKVACKIAVDDGLFPDPPWTFGTVTLNKIMKHYQLKRGQEKVKLSQEGAKPKPVETPKECYIGLMNRVGMKHLPKDWNYSKAYRYAVSEGLVPILSREQKMEFAQQVRDEMLQKDVDGIEKTLTETLLNNKEMFAAECRKRLMIKHLKENYGDLKEDY